MPKASWGQFSFNAGQFGRYMPGRADYEKYNSGCKRLENAIPVKQGPAKKRPGTYFVHEVKDSTDGAWLLPFVYSAGTSYVLEFGDLYVRFYTDHGIVESSPGVPYEVVTPYAVADLTNSDGTLALDITQSGDVLYICCPGYQPQKLTRTSSTSWAITDYVPYGGPFEDIDPDQTVTVYASAATGAVTLTASSSTFVAGDVGSLFLLESKDTETVKAWEPGKSISTGDLRRYGYNVYEALNTKSTGTIAPIHTRGARYDGHDGVQWEYRHSGYGWVLITGYTSGTSVSATVVSRIPSDAVGSGNATTRWAKSAWSDVNGWPTHVTFYKERLTFARDANLWFSVVSDFENFSSRDAGQITPDMAISITIQSDVTNSVKWMAPSDVLMVGTDGGEHVIRQISTSSAFAPGNVQASPAPVSYGGRHVTPVRGNGGVVYAQRTGKKFRELKYSFETDGYKSTDLNMLADNLADGQIVQAAYQQDPDTVIWACLENGDLVGMTYDSDESVVGWHRHPLWSGDATVESVCVVPDPDGGHDELWMVQRFAVDGSTKRYVCYMAKSWYEDDGVEAAFFVDCGLSYSGSAVSTVSGLDHLEGVTVAVLADGSTHPDCVVTSGAITLNRSASDIHVGLPYRYLLETMNVEAGSSNGVAQSKTKRADRVSVRLIETVGMKAGPDENNLDEVTFRAASVPMNSPVPPFTGDKTMAWPGGYDTDGRFVIVHDTPLPITVAAIFAHVDTQDRL